MISRITPRCQTVGESIGEVMEEAQEALGLYLASLIEVVLCQDLVQIETLLDQSIK